RSLLRSHTVPAHPPPDTDGAASPALRGPLSDRLADWTPMYGYPVAWHPPAAVNAVPVRGACRSPGLVARSEYPELSQPRPTSSRLVDCVTLVVEARHPVFLPAA